MSAEWWDNFRGRCVACISCQRNGKFLICYNVEAHSRGLHKRLVGSGGGWNGDAVSPMFGCVYFDSANKSINTVERNENE
jgi:hypothetical protein